ncbi:MAG TPA: hypothetical protein VJA25_04910 [Dehalococcoidia bacterium]|nr:hypothetical protein [Dehalococcoidia bacterium]
MHKRRYKGFDYETGKRAVAAKPFDPLAFAVPVLVEMARGQLGEGADTEAVETVTVEGETPVVITGTSEELTEAEGTDDT